MVKHVVIAAALTAALSGSAAVAQTSRQVEARYSADYRNCMKTGDAADGVTAGITECNGAEIERQDARLNQAYKMVMSRLTAPQKATLRLSEPTWINQRDTRCKRASSEEAGGSLERIIYGGCFLDETIKRTMWLEAYRG